MNWPRAMNELIVEQKRLALLEPPPWAPDGGPGSIGGCSVCFRRLRPGVGEKGDRDRSAAT